MNRWKEANKPKSLSRLRRKLDPDAVERATRRVTTERIYIHGLQQDLAARGVDVSKLPPKTRQSITKLTQRLEAIDRARAA